MTTQTVERQVTDPAGSATPQDETQPLMSWSDTTTAPDLIGVFDEAIQGDDAEGFAAVFEWAVQQEFPEAHAQQLRRDAWGQSG